LASSEAFIWEFFPGDVNLTQAGVSHRRGPKFEARMVGFLGRGAVSPLSTSYRVDLKECCKLLQCQWGLGLSP